MGFKKKRLSDKEYKALCFLGYTRDGWKCRVCKSRNNLHAHHIVFRSQGGADELSNICTLCNNCHEKVHQGKLKLDAFN